MYARIRHVIRLASEPLDNCRRRIQQRGRHHRGRTGDPLHSAQRTLHTRADVLNDKQRRRLDAPFTADDHAEVEANWGIQECMIAAYREPDRARGKEMVQAVIDSLSTGVPTVLAELRTPGRTLNRRGSRCAGILRAARHLQRPH